MSKRTKILAVVLGVVVGLWLVAGFVAGYIVTHPGRTEIWDREDLAGKPVENVTIRTEDGVTLSAWHVPNSPDRAVILLAGIMADRRQTIGHGKYYVELGYSVLLPDLRATGNSGGNAVTIGWQERKDLIACYKFLRDRGYDHIGADGISLGAATICYSLKEVDDFAFIVLESCYDTIDNALNNRLDMFHVPHFVAWPFRWFGPIWIGAGVDELRPVDFMPYCTAPALIMAGDSEKELKVSETQSLFDRCASEYKRLCIFKGGKHQNFLKGFPEQYRRELREFLEEVAASWQAAEAA